MANDLIESSLCNENLCLCNETLLSSIWLPNYILCNNLYNEWVNRNKVLLNSVNHSSKLIIPRWGLWLIRSTGRNLGLATAEVGAVLWDWALNLVDLTLSPGGWYQNWLRGHPDTASAGEFTELIDWCVRKHPHTSVHTVVKYRVEGKKYFGLVCFHVLDYPGCDKAGTSGCSQEVEQKALESGELAVHSKENVAQTSESGTPGFDFHLNLPRSGLIPWTNWGKFPSLSYFILRSIK
jgi:hypothetical protein